MIRKKLSFIFVLLATGCVKAEPPMLAGNFLKNQPTIIEEINAKNSQILSLFCEEVAVRVHGINSKARIAYEKDKHFRMTCWSILGQEADIGSNDKEFWFWSKRLRPKGFYYAEHANLQRTRLKTPFIPLWIMESLSVGTLTANYTTLVQGNKLLLSEPRINALGQPITKVTAIDIKRKLIIGHYCYDKNGKLEVSSEVVEFTPQDIPKRIQIQWLEEDLTMTLEFKNPETNVHLDARLWELPNAKMKIQL